MCLWQVVRVALMGLKNLLADPALDVGPEAVESGLPKVVQQRLLQVHTIPLLVLLWQSDLCGCHRGDTTGAPAI